jgi:formylglycine-generating enzyme required for sulfatase activity
MALAVWSTPRGEEASELVAEPSPSAALPRPVAPPAAVPKADMPTRPPLAEAPFNTRQARAHQDAWAKFLAIPVERMNSVGMNMVLIPPGTFLMGSAPQEINAAKEMAKAAGASPGNLKPLEQEGPRRHVTLTKPFLCSSTEVTVAQYEAFVRETGYQSTSAKKGAEAATKGASGSSKDPSDGAPPSHPATHVTWYDAQAFCNWLSARDGFAPAYPQAKWWVERANLPAGYRLPTEAQWEFACRAGTTSIYFFADHDRFLSQYVVVGTKNGPVSAVAEKRANAFGLFDMLGNAQEFTQDGMEPYTDEAAINPEVPVSDMVATRGSAMQPPYTQYRSAGRRPSSPKNAVSYVGFRVVRPLDAAPTNP